MKRVLAWFLQAVVIGSLGLLALSALIWWVGPLIGLGESRPLAGLWTRVILLVLIWALWIARLAWLAWRRKQLHKALVQGLGADANAADHEAKLLASRVDEAMAKLRAGSQRSLLSPGAFLYELPWYMFIGAPGSGKTTALLHAGLQFLLGDAAQGKPVAGVGGTRNCDWWFTQEAVLIDTAGRYATQDSEAATDAAAWKSFLALLRRTRPRQPLNGVLLTLSVQDLLTMGTAERQAQAAKLRSRLAELQTELGMAPPVYVLLTKADLLAGFNESFGDWPKEQRDQVWGFSLAHPAPADLGAAFDAAYAQLEQRLVDGLPERLQAIRQPEQRAAAFGFPQQLALLRPLLRDSFATLFASGGGLERTPQVRGVYFTSGTQDGTPIDRLMGSLGRAFGLERGAGQLLAGGQGKSFFLLRLLRDVVFAERGLGAWNAAAERRRGLLRIGSMAAIGLAATLVLVGWALSYVRNQGYAREVADRLPQIRQQIEALPAPPSGDLSLLMQPLAALRAAAQPAGWDAADPPLSAGLGLGQFDKLDAGARIAYERALQTAFAPRIAQRLEDRLRAANRDNLENAYEALKNYLMLYQPEQFDADGLRAWIGVDWDRQFAAFEAQQRAQLDAQLDDWLKLGAPPALRAQDASLVAGVREMLTAFPLEHRVYNRLKRGSRGQDLPDFTVAGAAGPRAAQVLLRASGKPLSQGVPGLFTKDGYRRTFQQSVAKASTQLAAEEGWVLGLRRDAAAMKDIALGSQVADRVRRLYLEEYIQVWDALLQDVRVQPLSDLSRSVEVSRILAGVDSPLAALVRRAAEETTLVQAAAAPAPGPLGAAAEAAALAAKQAREDAARLADAGPASTAGAGGPPERIVDEHFAALRRAAAGSDDTRKLFEELNASLLAIDAAQKSKAPPPAGGGGERIKAAAGQQPEPVRSMLEALADAGAKSSRGAERDVLTGELRPITEFCQRAIANRYPFAPSSRADVMPEDFGQLFGAGGMLDDFYQRRLAALVDTGQAVWTYRPLPDGTRPPAPAALAEFQRAARIREVFFRAGGRAPAFRIDLRLVEADGGLKELQLDLDGQLLKLTPGGAAATVSWPSQRVAAQVKLNSLPALAQPLLTEGPWALFRLFDRFELRPTQQPERFVVAMQLDGRRAQLEVTATSVFNPLRLREIQQFRCPGAM